MDGESRGRRRGEKGERKVRERGRDSIEGVK
jgi:hypothetical protein